MSGEIKAGQPSRARAIAENVVTMYLQGQPLLGAVEAAVEAGRELGCTHRSITMQPWQKGLYLAEGVREPLLLVPAEDTDAKGVDYCATSPLVEGGSVDTDRVIGQIRDQLATLAANAKGVDEAEPCQLCGDVGFYMGSVCQLCAPVVAGPAQTPPVDAKAVAVRRAREQLQKMLAEPTSTQLDRDEARQRVDEAERAWIADVAREAEDRVIEDLLGGSGSASGVAESVCEPELIPGRITTARIVAGGMAFTPDGIERIDQAAEQRAREAGRAAGRRPFYVGAIYTSTPPEAILCTHPAHLVTQGGTCSRCNSALRTDCRAWMGRELPMDRASRIRRALDSPAQVLGEDEPHGIPFQEWQTRAVLQLLGQMDREDPSC